MEAPLIATDRLAHVPEPIRAVIAQVKQDLVSYYGDRLQKVILFGSYARGDFHDESDIDLMPVISGTTQQDLKSNGLFDITYPRLVEDNVLVSIVPTLADRYERADTFLLMFVHQDGVEL